MLLGGPASHAAAAVLLILFFLRGTALASGISALLVSAAGGTSSIPSALGTLAAAASGLGSLLLVPFVGRAPFVSRSPAATSRLGGFLLIKFVGRSLFMGGPAAFTGDFTPFLGVHGRETARAPAMLACRAAVVIRHVGVVSGIFLLTRLVVFRRLTMVMGGRFVVEGGPAVMRGLAALAANLGHVFAVAAHGPTALATRLGCLLRIEFVCGPLGMGGSPPLAGDFTLFFLVHGRETAFALCGHPLSPSRGKPRFPDGKDPHTGPRGISKTGNREQLRARPRPGKGFAQQRANHCSLTRT